MILLTFVKLPGRENLLLRCIWTMLVYNDICYYHPARVNAILAEKGVDEATFRIAKNVDGYCKTSTTLPIPSLEKPF